MQDHDDAPEVYPEAVVLSDLGDALCSSSRETRFCLEKCFLLLFCFVFQSPTFLRAFMNISAVKISHDHHMNSSMLPTMHPPEHQHSTAAPGHGHGSDMMMMVSGKVIINQRAFPYVWFRVTCHLKD